MYTLFAILVSLIKAFANHLCAKYPFITKFIPEFNNLNAHYSCPKTDFLNDSEPFSVSSGANFAVMKTTMRTLLLAVVIMISHHISAQSEIDYFARTSAYELCKCVNNAYDGIDEEVVDLIISSYNLDKFAFNKLLKSKPESLRSRYHAQSQVMSNEMNRKKFLECSLDLKHEVANFDINVVDSKDNEEIFFDALLKYLGYNFDCKLSKYLLENKIEFNLNGDNTNNYPAPRNSRMQPDSSSVKKTFN